MKHLFYSFLTLLITFCSLTTQGQTTILEEDFSGGVLPSGWDLQAATPSVGWEIGEADALSTTIFDIPGPPTELVAASNDHAHDNPSGTQNDASRDVIMTPTLDLSQFGGIILEFDYFLPNYAGSKGFIEISFNFGTTWLTVEELTPDVDWRTGYFVDLSLYNFASNAIIGFRHDDGMQWADGFAIDNVHIFSPEPNNAYLVDVITNDYVGVGNVDIGMAVRNVGGNAINSVDVEYTINGGAPVAETVSGLAILPGSSFDVNFNTPANMPTTGSYTVEITIVQVNGQTDGDPSDNSARQRCVCHEHRT